MHARECTALAGFETPDTSARVPIPLPDGEAAAPRSAGIHPRAKSPEKIGTEDAPGDWRLSF